MIVLDAETGSVLRTFPLPKGIHNFIFGPDGADCYAFSIAGSVVRLNAENGHLLSQAAIPNVRGLAWMGDRSHLVVGSRGRIFLLNPQDLSVARTYAGLPVGQTFYPSASPDGSIFLVPAVLDGVVLVLDAKTGEVRQRVATGSPLQIVFDGKYAWISNVKVPASMLPSGTSERPGGLVRMDLSTFEFKVFDDTEDANGIAITR
jgi:hypothetical protein